MMGFPLRSIVRRHLAKTCRFFEVDNPRDLPVTLPLCEREGVIGWYRNPPPWERCAVVFTDSAIYSAEDDAVVRVDVKDIQDYEFPKSKAEVSGVRVRASEGFVFFRIAGARGSGGRYKDVFDFIK